MKIHLLFIIPTLIFCLLLSGCGLIANTACDNLAVVVSEAVKLICASNTDATKTSSGVEREKFIVINSDTVRYTVSVKHNTVTVAWRSNLGLTGEVVANR